MPPDSLCNLQLAGGRPYVVAHDALPPIRSPSPGRRAGEDPVLGTGVGCMETPSFESLRQVRVERDWLLRCLGLARAGHLHHDRANHADLLAGEIDVLPLQRKQLTHSQSRTNVQKHEGALSQPERVEQQLNFGDAEDLRYPSALSTLADQSNRIAIVEIVANRVIEKNTHYISDLGTGR